MGRDVFSDIRRGKSFQNSVDVIIFMACYDIQQDDLDLETVGYILVLIWLRNVSVRVTNKNDKEQKSKRLCRQCKQSALH